MYVLFVRTCSFHFLDFDEYSQDDQGTTGQRDNLDVPANTMSGSSHESSPAHTPSPVIRQHRSSLTNQSPLIENRRSADCSSEGSNRSSLQEAACNEVTNGLPDSSKLSIYHMRKLDNGHSRSGSNGSWSSLHSDGERDSGVGSTVTSANSATSEKGKRVGRAASPNILISQFENVHASDDKKKRPSSYVA